ncbi:GLPGLI family protein [uncultured Aquimarina sp.]|uniref:GLPGLI family protein n=1 Tax=uncultured Aquimarina sp. TaxID=575652 RepID=UPI00261CC260|nr:GLPGLI family protein [uncultured Aquimarina sp.]
MNKNLLLIVLLFTFHNYTIAQTIEVGYKEYYSLAGYGLDIVREEINNSTEKITPDFILRYRDGESIYIKTEDLPLYDTLNTTAKNNKNKIEKVSKKYKNHKTKELLSEYINYMNPLYGKDIAINDTLYNYDWKLSEKTENIFGYTCKSASTINKSGREVLVWYTDEVPIKAGPREYWGLPGLIVQIEIDDKVLIFTTHVTRLDQNLPIYRPNLKNAITRENFLVLKEKIHQPRTVKLKDGTEIIVRKGN